MGLKELSLDSREAVYMRALIDARASIAKLDSGSGDASLLRQEFSKIRKSMLSGGYSSERLMEFTEFLSRMEEGNRLGELAE